jgi:hypothetical protein
MEETNKDTKIDQLTRFQSGMIVSALWLMFSVPINFYIYANTDFNLLFCNVIMFSPIIIGWLYEFLILKFKASKAIIKYSIISSVCFISLSVLILHSMGCSIVESFILIAIGLGCLIGLMIFMALAWFFVYGLFYAANKAITDVKRNNHDK